MPGIAELAMGAAPIAGGVLLGAVAENMKGPDIRAGIIADFDPLDRIPAEQTDRRAAMSQMIGQRIDTLVEAGERSRQLRNAAASYEGNWRDIVVFVCAVLFTIVWWHVNHHRSNWLPMFVMLIVLSVITGIYAVRGVGRVLTQLSRRTGSTFAAPGTVANFSKRPDLLDGRMDLPRQADTVARCARRYWSQPPPETQNEGVAEV